MFWNGQLWLLISRRDLGVDLAIRENGFSSLLVKIVVVFQNVDLNP
jgi:hypothetical protein